MLTVCTHTCTSTKSHTFMQRHSRDLIIATYESREAILYYWNTFIFLLIVKKVLLKGKKVLCWKRGGEAGKFIIMILAICVLFISFYLITFLHLDWYCILAETALLSHLILSLTHRDTSWHLLILQKPLDEIPHLALTLLWIIFLGSK